MSELVEIKAEDLKWCTYLFRFYIPEYTCDDGEYYEDEYRGLTTYNKKPIVECNDGDYGFSETVLVNHKEYEQAVIERIKEMLPHAKLISKFKDGRIVISSICWNEPWNNVMTEIKPDCRPWESEYTINLQEEDNE